MEIIGKNLSDLNSISYTSFLYYKEFVTELTEIINVAISKQKSDVQQLAQYDLDICSFYVKQSILTPKDKIYIQLDSKIRLQDGSVYPDVNKFTEKQFEYYEKQMEETSNDFLKARYAHFLYLHGDKKKKYKYSTFLLPALSKIISVYQSHDQSHDDNMSSVFAIACLAEVSMAMSNITMLTKSIEQLISQLAISKEKKDYINILQCSNILRAILLSKFDKQISEEISNTIIECLESSVKMLFENKEYLNFRNLCKEYGKYERLKLIDNNKAFQLKLEIGKSYELEAEFQSGIKPSSPVRKVSILNLALEHYKNIGVTEKVDEMKLLIRKILESKEYDESFSRISVEQPFDQSQYDEIVNKFTSLPLEKSIEIIVTDDYLIPKIEQISNDVLKLSESNPIQFLVQNLVSEDGKIIKKSNNKEDSIELYKIKEYDLNLCINMKFILQPIFEKITDEQNFNLAFLMEKFDTWGLLPKQNMHFVESGLERFFSGDYISSIHTLVPQFEYTLRKMFSDAGLSTTVIREGNTQQELSLNELLNKDEVKSALGVDIHALFNHVMVEQTGWNLRNKIAHGIINCSDVSKTKCITIIYLFLLLTRFYLADSQE
ncbi:DUF4209 domain-containing protein [Carnobacterium divergens]|uniref:DUF4209 domain-containing protein n=1 Tax=Carnobacterium divergens TaxID=2748 RepID=UPI0039C9099E